MTPTINDNSSMADIRAMLGAPAPVTEPEPATSETAAVETPAAEQHHEAATEPAATKSEPVKAEEDEPLPEGVQKRIAKEAERAARAQSAIDRAVSERKAKEAEAAKLAGKPGSEPAPNTEPATGKPKRPSLGESGHENETWDQYQAREASYSDARDSWIKAETLREFEAKATERQQQAARTARWDEAVKEHGAEFPTHMETLTATAPEGLQLAISALDQWSKVGVYLAKNPAQLSELSAEFKQNPTKATIKLGRIEASLITTPKPAATKPLPEPLAKVGGNASASTPDNQSLLESGSVGAAKKAWLKMTAK